MFGKSKPVVFDPYGSRRRSRLRVPRWLVLLTLGVAAGAGGVMYVQERYLPPRLTAQESSKVQSAYDQADGERQRLKIELAATAKRLDAALAEKKTVAEELAVNRQAVARSREDMSSLLVALPPDPRGGEVHVRAARFVPTDDGKLRYDIVLARDVGSGGKPLNGVVQFVVAGSPGKRGGETTVKLTPVVVSVRNFEVLRGDLPLPEGFDARQATINVLDRPDGKLLGMRVMNVSNGAGAVGPSSKALKAARVAVR